MRVIATSMERYAASTCASARSLVLSVSPGRARLWRRLLGPNGTVQSWLGGASQEQRIVDRRGQHRADDGPGPVHDLSLRHAARKRGT
jgi:hypothetical protein